VRCPGGREVSVNMRDLAPCPGDVALRPTQGQRSSPVSLNVRGDNADDSASRVNLDVCGTNEQQSDSPVNESDLSLSKHDFISRRSARSNKNVPQLRYVPS